MSSRRSRCSVRHLFSALPGHSLESQPLKSYGKLFNSCTQLSGELLLGQPILVKSSEHERNLMWEIQQARTEKTAEQHRGAQVSGSALRLTSWFMVLS